MKNILLACAPSRIDSPLRRSLAHLAKSCQVEVAHNGYLVFEELYAKTFDLIIIDFAIGGVDSLELAESIQYIDPDVPVILMIPKAHKAIADDVHQFRVRPIICPFKPLTFLRLVDQLLHQHLNRYRQLAATLQNIVELLRTNTNAVCAFLTEETGQILVTSGEVKGISLEALSDLTVQSYTSVHELSNFSLQNKNLYVSTGARETYHLYTTIVFEDLYLALVLAVMTDSGNVSVTWQMLDKASSEMRQAFQNQTEVDLLNEETAAAVPSRLFISLEPDDGSTSTDAPTQPNAETNNFPVNWQIITQTPIVLNRLQGFCRTG